MKILVTSIGTRGDMEPFLAIGEILKKKGHEVICLFPEQFSSLAQSSGFEFYSLGREFMDMLESDLGKFALGGKGGQWKKIWAFIQLTKTQAKINKMMVEKQLEVINDLNPERIIHNGKVMYPVIWEADHPGTTVYVSPVPYLHYVKGHTHTAFHSDYGEWLNKLTYRLADLGILRTIMGIVKWLQVSGVSRVQIKKALDEHKIIYTISQALLERPEYWRSNMKVLGYHERDKTLDWKPEQSLSDFVDRHDKILFVTFGSMTNPEPEKKTKIILDVLKRNNIPAILNTSEGGLIPLADYDENQFYFVSQIPYDWLLPQVYAMMHHGGSGTTHMAVKNGCASLIVPHIIDQFVWNQMLSEKGVGPKGPKISKLTAKNLEPLVLDLMNNDSYKQRATELANQMKAEDLEEELVREILK